MARQSAVCTGLSDCEAAMSVWSWPSHSCIIISTDHPVAKQDVFIQPSEKNWFEEKSEFLGILSSCRVTWAARPHENSIRPPSSHRAKGKQFSQHPLQEFCRPSANQPHHPPAYQAKQHKSLKQYFDDRHLAALEVVWCAL